MTKPTKMIRVSNQAVWKWFMDVMEELGEATYVDTLVVLLRRYRMSDKEAPHVICCPECLHYYKCLGERKTVK